MITLDQIMMAPEQARDLSEDERQALTLRLAAVSAVLDVAVRANASFQDLTDEIVRDYRVNRRTSLSALVQPDGADGSRIAHLRAAFGKLRAVEINAALLVKYQDDRLSAGAARGTINRELACLKRMFALAVEHGSLRRSNLPHFPRALAEDNVREGFCDSATWEAVCKLMPLDLQDAPRWIYRTGWRVGAVVQLEWRAVDRANAMVRLERHGSKNRRPWRIPLADPELVEIIERAWAHRPLGCPFVFHRDGRRLTHSTLRKPWKRATRQAGVPGLLLHDGRRCAARNLIDAGVSQKVAMEITGHLTTAMFERYDVRGEDDVRAAIQRQGEYLAELSNRRKVVPITAMRDRDQLALPLAK